MPPLILRVTPFRVDCVRGNYRERNYLVIHMSPQFAVP